jgi:hypothetical protein
VRPEERGDERVMDHQRVENEDVARVVEGARDGLDERFGDVEGHGGWFRGREGFREEAEGRWLWWWCWWWWMRTKERLW